MHHLSDVTVTCEELAELWFNYAPSTEELEGFRTTSLATGGTMVLFTQRVVTLTYLSIHQLRELISVPEPISSELSFSLSLYVLGLI